LNNKNKKKPKKKTESKRRKKLNLVLSKKEMRIDQYRTEPKAGESSKKLSEGRLKHTWPDLKATEGIKPNIAKDLNCGRGKR